MPGKSTTNLTRAAIEYTTLGIKFSPISPILQKRVRQMIKYFSLLSVSLRGSLKWKEWNSKCDPPTESHNRILDDLITVRLWSMFPMAQKNVFNYLFFFSPFIMCYRLYWFLFQPFWVADSCMTFCPFRIANLGWAKMDPVDPLRSIYLLVFCLGQTKFDPTRITWPAIHMCWHRQKNWPTFKQVELESTCSTHINHLYLKTLLQRSILLLFVR